MAGSVNSQFLTDYVGWPAVLLTGLLLRRTRRFFPSNDRDHP